MEIQTILKKTNKGGRPIGSIKEDAACHNPEAIKLQRRESNLKHKAMPGYIRTKIMNICRRNDLPQMDLQDKTIDELENILSSIKLSNLQKKMKT